MSKSLGERPSIHLYEIGKQDSSSFHAEKEASRSVLKKNENNVRWVK